MSERRAAALDAAWAALDVAGRLALLRSQGEGRIVFTTSFGLEDQVLTHLVAESRLSVDYATLDTGRLFPETYDLWAATEARYGLRIAPHAPRHDSLAKMIATQGVNGFRHSLDARATCCGVRKVEPLGRALAGAAVWLTGLRADQSANRGSFRFVDWDENRSLLKANPLLDWTRDDAVAFAESRNIPVSPLHDRGFLSIGCAPCTRAVRPGEPERSGRWWWEDEARKECGLHGGADGRRGRAATDELQRNEAAA